MMICLDMCALEFIHQYERGEGDYTRERREILKSFRLEGLAVGGRRKGADRGRRCRKAPPA